MKKMSSSFSMCFLPVVSDDDLMVRKRSKASDVKQVLSPEKNTVESKDKNAAGNSFGRKTNKLGRRSLSRFVNAVFFETSLTKKMKSKKLGQKLHRNYNGDGSEFKSKSKKISNPTINDAQCEDINRSISSISSKASSRLSKGSSLSSSSLMTSSGRSSSSWRSSLMTTSGRSSSSLLRSSLMTASGPCNSGASSETMGNNRKVEKRGHGSNIACYCLLLTSLLVLVIWGKVCAIFCTSTMLVFANRWIKLLKHGPSGNVTVDVHRLPEIDSRLHRKKIIMEGLLKRNHSRNVY